MHWGGKKKIDGRVRWGGSGGGDTKKIDDRVRLGDWIAPVGLDNTVDAVDHLSLSISLSVCVRQGLMAMISGALL